MADHSCGSSGDNSGYSTWLCNHGRLFWIQRLDRFGFLFFCGHKWYHYVLQFLSIFYINAVLSGGQYYPVELFGMQLEISHQGFAVLALLPIWLYSGERGPYNKTIQWIWYAFYPVHMTILFFIYRYMWG